MVLSRIDERRWSPESEERPRKRPRTVSHSRHSKRHAFQQIFKLVFNYILTEGGIKLSEPSSTATRRTPRQELYPDKLRQLQPLTTICRSWRRATLPLFFQTAACSIRELVPSDRYATNSNIELIISAGYQKYVSQLSVEFEGDISPDLLISLLTDEGFGDVHWSKIKSLRFGHSQVGKPQQRPKYRDPAAVSRLNAYLLHNLPRLTSVQYTSSPTDRQYYSEFPLDGLLASSLGQLEELRVVSGLIPRMPSVAFFPRLTSLTLCCPIYSGSGHLPQIFSETLEHLQIGFSSAESLWDRFYVADDQYSVIEFKQLKSLVLEYYEAIYSRRRMTRDRRSIRLLGECDSATTAVEDVDAIGSLFDYDSESENIQAPAVERTVVVVERTRPTFVKLQSLCIRKFPYDITQILEYFPLRHIQHISVNDVTKGWSHISSASVSELSSLRVHIVRPIESSNDTRTFQLWINRLLSVTSSLSHLQLQAPIAAPVSLPDVIGLTKLVRLSISMSVDLGTIPNLLSRLPNLHYLAMHVHQQQSSWFARNEGVFALGDYQMLNGLPPLSRSLQKLVVYIGLESESPADGGGRRLTIDNDNNNGGDRWDKAAADPLLIERELVWVLARIPSLNIVKTDDWTSRALRLCMDEMLAQCSIRPIIQHFTTLDLAEWEY